MSAETQFALLFIGLIVFTVGLFIQILSANSLAKKTELIMQTQQKARNLEREVQNFRAKSERSTTQNKERQCTAHEGGT